MTMSQIEKETNAAAASETNEQVCQNVVTRVANLQLVSSTYEKVSTTYAATKDDHPVVKSVFDVAEKGIKTVATVAADGVQPILTKLEPQIAVVNEYACQGLDKLEEKLPILQQPVDKVISDTKELLSTTVAGAKGTIYSTVAEAQNAVTGMVDMVKETVQGSVAATKTMVTSSMSTVMESTVGQKLASRIDKLLGKSEEWVDNFLPITDEELAKVAASLEGFEIETVSVEQQKLQKSYYVRLGSLSTKVRQRAYQHSLRKMKEMSQHTKECLSLLQQALDLMEYSKQMVDQKLHDVQEKLNRIWRTPQPGMSEEADLPKPEQIDYQVLVVLHYITKHLQATCVGLISSLQGLPDNIQEQVHEFQRSIDELHAYFSSAASFWDLSDSIFSQSKEKVIKAQKSLDELLEYVTHNVPLTWLVGPFAPSGEPAEGVTSGEPAEGVTSGEPAEGVTSGEPAEGVKVREIDQPANARP